MIIENIGCGKQPPPFRVWTVDGAIPKRGDVIEALGRRYHVMRVVWRLRWPLLGMGRIEAVAMVREETTPGEQPDA